MESCRYKKGVTLIEMLIVVSMIALLVSIALGAVEVIDRQAKKQVTKSTFQLIETALQEYHEFSDSYPNSVQMETDSMSLYEALSTVPNSRKTLQSSANFTVKNKGGTPQICDGWGTVLNYIYIDGQTFPELISAGPNRTFGTVDNPGDDISNRQP